MKRTLLISFIAAAALCACDNSHKSPLARKVAEYAPYTIETPDLSGITDNGKEVLNLYRFAADEVNAIYWKQYFGDRENLMSLLTDPYQKAFAEINYGPWDRVDGTSFVEGYADRLPGAGFYPADMTKEEFEAWDNPDKLSPYTMIRRAEDGTLQAVWYHDAYREHIAKIANYLSAAADITIKPSVRNYLLSKAEALQSDKYYDSGIAWLEMNDSKMDLVIGPNETADDQLFGIKRSYEAFVLLKNEAKTEELMQYVSRIAELRDALPGDPAYKTFLPGTGSNIFSCDALYYAGKANAGIKVMAVNLPFDPDVQRDKGTRTILLDNIIRAKYNSIIAPSGDVLLTPDDATHLSPDAFYWNVVFREVAHGLGVRETVNGKGSVEEALGSSALCFEEVKTLAAGVLLVCKLQEHFDIRHIFTKEDALTTFFVTLVRAERFGEGSALGRANTMVYNYLREAGAFELRPSGQYAISHDKMFDALSSLVASVLEIQATGDATGAVGMEQKYSHRSAEFSADLRNLSLENIPMDIRFE
ncbi:MAG: Zn-dependent hydrolase [Bacteroidales bacterium]|nr:Zn-dependent hydrolase [Bacteroidales bacterium]